jgi:hypothetical protein
MNTRLLLIALAAATTLAASAGATSYKYVTVDAPATANLLGTVVTGINNGGSAAGYYVVGGDPSQGQAPQNYHAFTVNSDGSGFTDIDRPGYWQTGAAGINDGGAIVGVSVSYTGVGTGFLRAADGSFTDINPTTLSSVYSEAVGINNAGAVVGYFTNTLPPSLDQIQAYSHGFIFDAGSYTQLDVPVGVGFGTELDSINSFGVIGGSYLDYSFAPHAFVYDLTSATFSYLGATGLSATPSSLPTQIGQINDAFAFPASVVSYDPASPVGFDATSFIVSGGMITPFGVPGADTTSGFGLNLSGRTTGFYVEGNAIHGFIATPAPEPATWALMLAGFGAIGWSSRRRRSVAVA